MKPILTLEGAYWGPEAAKINQMFKGIPEPILIGKKIWWCGTSIPNGCTYPENSAADVGATITNVAMASSCIRKQSSNGSYVGLPWKKYCWALSQTTAEKQYIIANWDSIKGDLTDSPPASLNASAQAVILNSSYEVKLTPYLNSDLFIFDHGINDVIAGESIDDYKALPATFNNRDYFVGAMNYLIEYILTNNPKARIAIFGFYENTAKPYIFDAQKVVADYWQIPICETWRYTRWSNKIINGVPNIQNWFPDGLHPYGDTSGEADLLLDRIASNFLRTIV